MNKNVGEMVRKMAQKMAKQKTRIGRMAFSKILRSRILKTAVLVASAIAGSILVSAQTLTMNTVAGGAPLPSPVTAINGAIGQPTSVAVDGSGNVYFTSTNSVYKLAGTTRHAHCRHGTPRLPWR